MPGRSWFDSHPSRVVQAVDERMSAWMGLPRRYRRPPADLAALLAEWKSELAALDAAADLETLQREAAAAKAIFEGEAKRVSAARRQAAPRLGAAVTQAMQQLGMAGGRFEASLLKQDEPQSFGLESAEFLVAGHAGSTPRPMAKVASGGELSRIALAISVTTSQLAHDKTAAGTLIFGEMPVRTVDHTSDSAPHRAMRRTPASSTRRFSPRRADVLNRTTAREPFGGNGGRTPSAAAASSCDAHAP